MPLLAVRKAYTHSKGLCRTKTLKSRNPRLLAHRFPVVTLLSSDAKMPFPGAPMYAAVLRSSSAYWFSFSKAVVIIIPGRPAEAFLAGRIALPANDRLPAGAAPTKVEAAKDEMM